MTTETKTMPFPPGFTDLSQIAPPVFATETPDGFILIYDPTRKLGCVWRPEAQMWSAWTPVELDDFTQAARAIVTEQAEARSVTADTLRRMMH